MDKLTIFINRLERIGIKTTYFSNYPWIYLDTVNSKKVTELFHANHGFTVYWSSTNQFTDIKTIFMVIRKYIK